MKKELLIYTAIFLFLAIGMHFKQWIDYPIEHLKALPNASSYGLGWEHPFVYTLIVYILVMAFRLFLRLFSKKSKEN